MKLTEALSENKKQTRDVWLVVTDYEGGSLQAFENAVVASSLKVANQALFNAFLQYLNDAWDENPNKDTLRDLHDKPSSLKGAKKPKLTVDNMEDHPHWKHFNEFNFLVKTVMIG